MRTRRKNKTVFRKNNFKTQDKTWVSKVLADFQKHPRIMKIVRTIGPVSLGNLLKMKEIRWHLKDRLFLERYRLLQNK